MLNDEIETKFNFKTKLESTRLTRRTLDLGHETMITPQKTNQEIVINPMLKDEVEKKNKLKKSKLGLNLTRKSRDSGHMNRITPQKEN